MIRVDYKCLLVLVTLLGTLNVLYIYLAKQRSGWGGSMFQLLNFAEVLNGQNTAHLYLELSDSWRSKWLEEEEIVRYTEILGAGVQGADDGLIAVRKYSEEREERVRSSRLRSYYYKSLNFRKCVSDFTTKSLIIQLHSEYSSEFPAALEYLHGMTNHSILIVGSCRLKLKMEKIVDQFLQRHRVWDYVYVPVGDPKDYCQLYAPHVESGVLLHLKRQPRYAESFRFFEHLDRLQFVDDVGECGARKRLVHTLNKEGMAATLHFLGYAMTRALDWNRTLILDSSLFRYAAEFTEIFLPITNCPLPHPQEMKEAQLFNDLKNYSEYDTSRDVTLISEFYRAYSLVLQPQFIPEGWFSKSSLIRFRSNLMNYLLRPNYFTRMKIVKALHSLHNDTLRPEHKCVSMHVRNGDKRRESDLFYFPDDFMSLMDKYQVLSKIKNVFLMSDNSSLFDQNANRYKYKNYDICYLKDVRRVDDQNKLDPSPKRSKDIGIGLFTEIFIASQCDYFLGTMTSNIGRLIVELMISNPQRKDLDNPFLANEYRTQYISLDELWHVDP